MKCGRPFYNRKQAINSKLEMSKRPIVNCEICGAEFMFVNKKKCCSEKCAHKKRYKVVAKSPITRERSNLMRIFGTTAASLDIKKMVATLILMNNCSKYIIKLTKQQKKQAMIRINKGDTLAAYEY